MKKVAALLVFLAGCGDGGGGATQDAGPADAAHTLAEFLPEVPTPDGTARTVFAGTVTSAAELIPGAAATGLVGDLFMRSSKARFVIQAADRSIGIVPFGGNVIDAVLLGSDGKDVTGDQLGEIGLIYMVGRTCNHTKVEILSDGSGGGPAVIRATGKTAVNDYVNLRGLGAIPIPAAIDPDYTEDDAGCATTYTLRPGATSLEIAWTLFNPGKLPVSGPFGMLNDSGGEVELFAPGFGFYHLQGAIDQLLAGGDISVPYQVYQGPGVAYGVVPRLETSDIASASLVVSGAAILIFGAHEFLDVLDRNSDYLDLPAGGGVTHRAELVVGRDAADVERAFRAGRDEAVTAVTGHVTTMATRARVVVFDDLGADGVLGDADRPRTYFDTRPDGTFGGALPAGKYLLRADASGVARSPAVAVTVGSAAVTVPEITIPEPARFDYTVLDDADGRVTVPAKITVVGRTPVAADGRSAQTYEDRFGIVRTVFAMHGASAPAAGLADPAIILPAGGPYRIFFSHGPEWSVASTKVMAVAGQQVTLPPVRLRRVVDTAGYVATGFHEHSLGSPDSPVAYEKRLGSLVVEGIELFAGTEHDFLHDFDPLIDAQGLRGTIDAVVGVETTPFAYGHFNAYPLDLDVTDPSGGATDWGASSRRGFAMLPSEIFADMRQRGARVVQVCHPRETGVGAFQGFFGRAGLTFDFATRSYGTVTLNQDLPNEYLRLPENEAIFSDSFDALEIYKSFGRGDTNGDGVVEIPEMDRVLRDWMNFLSLGKRFAPLGNGDTHTETRDTAGMPRTLVRVPDDSSAAIATGVDEEVWRTISGTAARDLVVSGGAFIRVTEPGEGKPSLLGQTIAAQGGSVTLSIVATSAFADLDTIEVFANNTFDRLAQNAPTSLQPVACFTSRTSLHAKDPCRLAPWKGGAQPLAVASVDAGNGFTRREARATITLRAEDIPARAGASGSDAWLVVRVRGGGSMFPVIAEDTLGADILDAVIDGDTAALTGRGVPPMAFTAPVFIDFDGGGYRAIFQP